METKRPSGETVAQSPFFKKVLGRAEEYLKKPLRVKELLNDAYTKASEKKDFGTIASEVWESMQVLMRMIKASVSGDYHGIPTPTLIGGVAVFLYFLTPIDFVPDFIPVIGLLDDVSLLAWFMTSIKGEMERFAEWEASGSPSHAVSKVKTIPVTGKTTASKKGATSGQATETDGTSVQMTGKHEEEPKKRAASSGSGEPNVRASTTDSTRVPSSNADDSTAGGNVR